MARGVEVQQSATPIKATNFAMPVENMVEGHHPQPLSQVAPSSPAKVSRKVKWAIGIGGTVIAAQSAINGFYLQIFLLETVRALHPTPRAPRAPRTPCTPHSAPRAPRPAPHAPHPAPASPKSAPCSNPPPLIPAAVCVTASSEHVCARQACLPARFVGTLQLVQGLFDAFNDTVIGHASNKVLCGARCGRRRPWLFAATVPLGATFCLLWQSLPDGTSDMAKFYYYLLAYCGLSIAVTMVEVQVACITAEVTQDYDERTAVAAYRLGIGSVLALPMVICHGVTVQSQPSLKEGYSLAGFLFGAILACCPLALAVFAKPSILISRPPDPDAQRMHYFKGLLVAFKNKAFVYVMFMHMLGLLSVALIQVNVFLWLKYVLEREDLGNAVIFAVQGVGLLCFPLWAFLTKKLGKKRAYYIGTSVISCSLFFGLFVIPP
eukprot:SAG11_NODE_4425_length_1900_cov_1.262632_1_plen_434_part_10